MGIDWFVVFDIDGEDVYLIFFDELGVVWVVD